MFILYVMQFGENGKVRKGGKLIILYIDTQNNELELVVKLRRNHFFAASFGC
jgi:hypothetical protein